MFREPNMNTLAPTVVEPLLRPPPPTSPPPPPPSHTSLHGHYVTERVKNAVDGCVNVFVDAGASIGVHTRFLFEPAFYNDSKFVAVFDRVFGVDRNLTCSLGFEPNPIHKARHEKMQRVYARMGWRYTFFPMALGTASEELVFHENGDFEDNGKDNEYWGFGVTNFNEAFRGASNRTGQNLIVRVPSVSFDEILSQISRRAMPSIHPRGRVIVKMDIEGLEFAVVPQVVASGNLCRVVDWISVEWHPKLAPLRLHSNQRLHLDTILNAQTTASVLKGAIKDGLRAAGCRTEVRPMDDESYLHDRVPLPVLGGAL
ncbi:hypothetical protein EMIHUDRAFT_222266 [Emiliania huxleyi CCMP1516]|uniref:Methyltransferase FkbM domain-containing protein n=2 Tax=Emiliania huxleyi TaxID=2903 RepID=A0A0D3KYP5_EMIH1|nr:hypothetical protein EMIHUDRAFT_222266 [Emiliania huxleyi CCMP1516]EOD40880.1 hypothetical protein EMIHUDRAFT_222266 [Emiliania huxleyi CCMP1516]|eukprot:XP_005793309.1 hypothetical protein EMIHUDRAFT_222266 [Emiliania huxleyi CCMP1516]